MTSYISAKTSIFFEVLLLKTRDTLG